MSGVRTACAEVGFVVRWCGAMDIRTRGCDRSLIVNFLFRRLSSQAFLFCHCEAVLGKIMRPGETPWRDASKLKWSTEFVYNRHTVDVLCSRLAV